LKRVINSAGTLASMPTLRLAGNQANSAAGTLPALRH